MSADRWTWLHHEKACPSDAASHHRTPSMKAMCAKEKIATEGTCTMKVRSRPWRDDEDELPLQLVARTGGCRHIGAASIEI